jgi:hypothetical protein
MAPLLAADFRGANWGMTPAEVIVVERHPPEQVPAGNGETALRFAPFEFEGHDAVVLYIFNNSRLVRAKYVFSAEHANLNHFVDDFKHIEQSLLEYHGHPTTTRAIWDNPAYQDESAAYLERDRGTPAEIFTSDRFVGKEILLGHLRLFTEWTSGRTKILHVLNGDGSRIIHQIEYSRTE